MRSFANSFGISAGTLSEILNRKRPLTAKMAVKIAAGLRMNDRDTKEFLNSVAAQNRERKLSIYIPGSPKKQHKVVVLSSDDLAEMKEWYHYAILDLMGTADYQDDHGWIADRLGISAEEVAKAMSVFERLNLEPDSDITTTHDIPSPVLRYMHGQRLDLGTQALDVLPVELRDFSFVTVPINTAKLTQAKKIIRDFRRQFCSLFTGGDNNEVYTLNIQFFPLTKRF